MAELKKENPRGILNPNKGKEKFKLDRYVPSEEIAFFVEHFWIVEWDLSGNDPFVSETLPHPCVHVVFEKERSYVIGVTKEKFSRTLVDKGIVFGIKFKPGGFYPFVKKPISSFTNRLIDLTDIFGDCSESIEKTILNLSGHDEMTACAEKFLHEILPERDENIVTINKISERIIADREIIRVDDLVDLFKLNKRQLQRLFNEYVGINPKWMIKRYRLHEAAEQLAGTANIDLTKLAIDLGYYDQAHFIKNFKSIVGKPPEKYAKQISANSQKG